MRQKNVRANKRSAAQGDEGKLRIIEFLDKAQTNGSEWFSRKDVAEGCHLDNNNCKALLFDMASEGWLHIRHDPQRPEILRYRLRREGDVI